MAERGPKVKKTTVNTTVGLLLKPNFPHFNSVYTFFFKALTAFFALQTQSGIEE